jgi:NADP-dependent 3-hydroxy acid dehydrogenase YdfG
MRERSFFVYLKGRIAVVTIASSGIGLATAKLLTCYGVRVILLSLSKEKFSMLAKDLPGQAEMFVHDWMGKRT